MKYVIIADCSGSMSYSGWKTMVQKCLLALKEKFSGYGTNMVPVYFASHEIVNRLWLDTSVDGLMSWFDKCNNGGTSAEILHEIQKREHADVVFVISDGSYDSWRSCLSSEMFVLVCDEARKHDVKSNMGSLPFKLLVVDRRKTLWEKFCLWGRKFFR